MDLLEFGVNGRIVHTPGHTTSSISLLLDSGEAFVCDLVVNYLPFDISIFPPFAEDTTQLIASWRKILRMGAKIILPAHGRPFSAEKFKSIFENGIADIYLELLPTSLGEKSKQLIS